MKRLLLALAFTICALTMTGCALPRAAGLYIAGMENTPLPPTSKRTAMRVDPFLCREGLPFFETSIVSQLPEQQVVDFYRERLASRGWTETKQYTNMFTWQRKRVVGRDKHRVVLADEQLSLRFAAPQNAGQAVSPGAIYAELEFTAWYLWDQPSRMPVVALGAVFGYGAMLFAPVLAPL
jgi:hypothetical protein